jgi:hypothetical protein
MSKFKIGDDVIFADNKINNDDEEYLLVDGFVIGDYATVTAVEGYFVYVDGEGPYDPERFEAVEEVDDNTDGDYIVAAIDEGAYAPAKTPKVLRSEEQAMKVAEKMAKKNDAEFAVFKRIAVLSPEGAEFDDGVAG